MTHTQIKIVFLLLLLATAGLHAQQSCYQTGLNEGIEIYNEAQRLERGGRCVEAVPRFWEALRRFRLVRSCRDLPANHELDSWEDRCIRGVTACGGKMDETTFLNVSPPSLSFAGAGGNLEITVNTNASAWKVDRTPSWCTARRSNNRLTVTCSENTGSAGRSETLVVVANTLRYEITITQAGKASVETSGCASIKINEVQFAGTYADGARSAHGEKLFNHMTFMIPRINLDHLAMESNKIKLDFKIFDPDGRLLSGSDSGYTFSDEITARGNLQKNDMADVSQWGAGIGTAFAATGKYTFEIWCSGANLFSTGFEIFPKPVSPHENIKITDVQFMGKYADGTAGDFGKILYNHMTFLVPRISYTHLTEGNKMLQLDFRLLDPSGNLMAPVSGSNWIREITVSENMQQTGVVDVSEWGSANATAFAQTGHYQFEIRCSGVSLFSTSFEVVKPVSPASPASTVSPASPIPSASPARLKAGAGIKAGLNLSTVSNGMTDLDFLPDMMPAFHAGILLNLNFGYKNDTPGFFGLQTELLFSRQGFSLYGNDVIFNYITVPFLAKLYLYQGFNLEVGPWFGYLFGVDPNSTVISDNNIQLSGLKGGKDAGVAAGIGYDFKFGLVIGARYQHGLSDLASNLLWTNRNIAVSLGWKF